MRRAFKVPEKNIKKRRLGDRSGGIRRRDEYPNHIWSVGYTFAGAVNGRSLTVLSLIDEFASQCIALDVHRMFSGWLPFRCLGSRHGSCLLRNFVSNRNFHDGGITIGSTPS